MDHRVFRFATRGQCIKGKKARLFWTHTHIFKLQCASIVYLLCTAIWWQIERFGGPLSSNLFFNQKSLLAFCFKYLTILTTPFETIQTTTTTTATGKFPNSNILCVHRGGRRRLRVLDPVRRARWRWRSSLVWPFASSWRRRVRQFFAHPEPELLDGDRRRERIQRHLALLHIEVDFVFLKLILCVIVKFYWKLFLIFMCHYYRWWHRIFPSPPWLGRWSY